MSEPFVYNCNLVKVVDGDTIDVDVDLGFSCWLRNKRVRLMGIDTPESRTRNLKEKALGLKAKERLIELCGEKLMLKSQGTDKYGRILGVPYTMDGLDMCNQLVEEGHAVPYFGGKKSYVWG
jgi:micrococcal nuclease